MPDPQAASSIPLDDTSRQPLGSPDTFDSHLLDPVGGNVADDGPRGPLHLRYRRAAARDGDQPGGLRRGVLAGVVRGIADHDAADGLEHAGPGPCVVPGAPPIHLPAERAGHARPGHGRPAAGVRIRRGNADRPASGGHPPGARRHIDPHSLAGGDRVPPFLPGHPRAPSPDPACGVRHRRPSGLDVGDGRCPRIDGLAAGSLDRRDGALRGRRDGGSREPMDGEARRGVDAVDHRTRIRHAAHDAGDRTLLLPARLDLGALDRARPACHISARPEPGPNRVAGRLACRQLDRLRLPQRRRRLPGGRRRLDRTAPGTRT